MSGGQWLVIMAEPQEAMVYIDEIYEAGEAGRVQKFLPLGRHTYRVDCALYHPEAGQVELSAENKQELSVRLRPCIRLCGNKFGTRSGSPGMDRRGRGGTNPLPE